MYQIYFPLSSSALSHYLFTHYNPAKPVSAKVAPNDSFNATLSWNSDRKSTLVKYFCRRPYGTRWIPLDSATYLSLAGCVNLLGIIFVRTCTPMTKSPISNARGFEKTETASPPMTPVMIFVSIHYSSPPNAHAQLFTAPVQSLKALIFRLSIGSIVPCFSLSLHIPRILPVLICLTAFGFNLPSFLTTGAFASRLYCEKLQSFTLAPPAGELSRRRRLRRECRVGRSSVVLRPRPMPKRARWESWGSAKDIFGGTVQSARRG